MSEYDSGGGNNPRVRSKFDRSHGKGLKAPHIQTPGGTAVKTSASVAPWTPGTTGTPVKKISTPLNMGTPKVVSPTSPLTENTDSIKQMKR